MAISVKSVLTAGVKKKKKLEDFRADSEGGKNEWDRKKNSFVCHS